MPVPSPTFGSTGDILSVVQLCWQLVAILREVNGASAEMLALLEDLDVCGRSLQAIYVVIGKRRAYMSNDVRNGIALCLQNCGQPLTAATAKVEDHRKRASRRDPVGWRAYWAAVSWSALGGKKEVDLLRQRLRDQISSINIFLQVSQSSDQAALLDAKQQQQTNTEQILGVLLEISRQLNDGVVVALHNAERRGQGAG